MNNTVKRIINSSEVFYKELQKDNNGRYLSWEHCYSNFIKARIQEKPDIDYLCLQLAFYLASWGMYRGSSFLLQKDYKVHTKVVKEILKKKYDSLAGIDCKDYYKESNQKLLMDLYSKIVEIYKPYRQDIKEDDKETVSSTLITKILMGTLGCVPAYDRYFISGIKNRKVTTGNFNIQSILKLVDFYVENMDSFEPVRKKMKVNGLPYPQMKMLDMGFWQLGYDLDPKNKGKNPR